ncbi:MAG: tRNA (adenosine(37)-N6)-threonylcarbamoyltransferase complex dimerization subunit type 1 TsaB [Bacteroidales bacterium]|jgi:tRNA threonylcarbamoyladenosine biosynthesis protein TsaB|nr:tRNA (adenosine(37)-N6)-threonylcarbamoyltransferase complex dimerization subunit type 1 TsaB [Bacteroidales bacterium]HPH53065.1 tRNA (adenosine(37)-N6)-threonylcarbamoyltransferase complex dimerization subunit type 1 TsaB [Bacteroidales bacterium]
MKDTVLLLLETSTEICSTVLTKGGEVIASRCCNRPKSHASKLAVQISEVFAESGITIAECDAVAVSEGPGSYTGLRVGVSTAKGLCFGSGKPLIAISTPQILTMAAIGRAEKIVALIDARRMEAYCAIFDSNGVPMSRVNSIIFEKESFRDLLDEGSVIFIGNAATKLHGVISHPNAIFEQCNPLAKHMIVPATEAFIKKEFKDVAYFEPFYLKDFVAGISKKKLF